VNVTFLDNSASVLRIARCLIVLGSFVAPLLTSAQTFYYFDVNGATTTSNKGVTTGTGSGIVEGSTWAWGTTGNVRYWTTDFDGATTTPTVWTDNLGVAVFSAGSDGTGAYTVTVASLTAGSILIQEGLPAFSINSGALLTVTGGISGTNKNLSILGAGNMTVGGVIATGSGTLTKSGAGILTLSGANIYTGGTILSAGTLTVATTGSLASTGALTVNAGTLNFNNTAGQTVSSLSGTGGTINLASGVTLTANQTTTTTFAGALAGAGGLAKSGAGTLTLEGANTYSGATTIDGGTLNLVGSLSSSSPITINTGGTLLLGASASLGTLTMNGGTLALEAMATATHSLGALMLTGASVLTLGSSAITLTFASTNPNAWSGAGSLLIQGFDSNLHTIVFTNTAFTSAHLARITFEGLGAATFDGTNLTAIPEPGTYALLLGCVSLLAIIVRRRRAGRGASS
jgi:fibronectin-binding autotransporter adhesin